MKKMMIALLTLGLLLAGCQAATSAETNTPNQETPENATGTVLEPTTAPAAVLPAPDDYCLDCHTDQEMLTALSTEEEDAHGSESEGVG